MAKRVAEERDVKLGTSVGYSIRFDDMSTTRTAIRYMTDGCLLQECLSDRNLMNYQVIILDEAHERCVATDVLFALIKRALAQRAGNLRVLVTSATLDTDLFSKYFGGAPIIRVRGQTHPVRIVYSPPASGIGRSGGVAKGNATRVEAAVNAALRLHLEGRSYAEYHNDDDAGNDAPNTSANSESGAGTGHILVFLTGRDDCELACQLCYRRMEQLVEEGRAVGDAVILPLYGALPGDAQARVFHNPDRECRKIIFATNVAETSLTVDGVEFVVDSGVVKQKLHNPKTGMEALQIVPISQVQCEQRSGRAGRTRAGVCFRLFSEEAFQLFERSTVPEIKRVALSGVVLELLCLGVRNVIEFDFLEPPPREFILSSLKRLRLLNAIDDEGKPTELGEQMARLPLDPTYAKCLLCAIDKDLVHEVVAIVSCMSTTGSLWCVPPKNRKSERDAARVRQAYWHHPSGDHITLLNVFEAWERTPPGKRNSWCQDNYLSPRGMRESSDIYKQLCDLCGRKINRVQIDDEDAVESRPAKTRHVSKSSGGRREGESRKNKDVLQCLTAGLFLNAARLAPSAECWICVDSGVLARPEEGSALERIGADRDDSPEWLIFSELSGAHESQQVGSLRNVSVVPAEIVAPLLDKMLKVNVTELLANCGSKEPSSNVRRQSAAKVDKKEPVVPAARDSAELSSKIGSARERYLARKAT
eukprot:Selendium_serpulae@DN5876_c0_g1_i3.p1